MENEWTNMPSGTELVSSTDPVQAAADLAEEITTKGFRKAEMLTKVTGFDKKLADMGIKINKDQAMKFFALLGAYQAWQVTKSYRKNIMIGVAAYLAYQNQEKILGQKVI